MNTINVRLAYSSCLACASSCSWFWRFVYSSWVTFPSPKKLGKSKTKGTGSPVFVPIQILTICIHFIKLRLLNARIFWISAQKIIEIYAPITIFIKSLKILNLKNVDFHQHLPSVTLVASTRKIIFVVKNKNIDHMKRSGCDGKSGIVTNNRNYYYIEANI